MESGGEKTEAAKTAVVVESNTNTSEALINKIKGINRLEKTEADLMSKIATQKTGGAVPQS